MAFGIVSYAALKADPAAGGRGRTGCCWCWRAVVARFIYLAKVKILAPNSERREREG